MSPIPYYDSLDDLLHGGRRRTVFAAGDKPSMELLCAELARLSYKHFERSRAERAELVEAVGRVGLRVLELFSRHNTQAFLAERPGRLRVVAFRGTEPNVPDALTDLKARLVPWPPGGMVHAGFARAFDQVWPALRLALEAGSTRVVFTGHSLGAALATLAMSAWTGGAKRLITFGSPRVGDAAFVALFRGKRVERFVDCCDIVTRVPPPGIHAGPVRAGYEHVHERAPIYIDRLRAVHATMPAAAIMEDRLLADAEYVLEHTFEPGAVATRALADHAAMNYVAPLQALQPRVEPALAAGVAP